ncbi:MAG TPA: DNA-directed RNA polymerase subunit alpha C-terminal domain-containing protein [Planctomycetaceae bacterium]|nr:DNA-directed RNA polymerase subunit alpha C-terminal domain-containing protein [Planctomycetaceae bacterium]
MATATEPSNVRELLREDPALAAGDVQRLTRLLSGPQLSEARQELRALEDEIASTDRPSPELLTRAGIACYLLGQHRRADEYLSWVTNENGPACFYHGLVLTALERHDEAEGQFADAAGYGYDPVECALRRAGAIRAQGRIDEAEQVLRSVSRQAASRAEYSYQMGCILADRGDAFGAIEYFERAVDMDPRHSRALFRLAAENALRGNDEIAIRLYERSLARPPLYLGSLLNLGLLYEDQENYAASAYCFRKILEHDPTHARARLYLRDIEAAGDMYYDDESARRQARLEQLLSRPITDFELTVRSRNCLQGMNIHTLGDLTRIGEQELLNGKNFGETSLKEVRDLMAEHDLQIGQNLGKPRPLPAYFERDLSPQEQAVLTRSVNDLNLSVRARKCMTRLGLTTVGELVQKTPDELLGTRNFGVTSLNEIRTRLGEMNLKLRND